MTPLSHFLSLFSLVSPIDAIHTFWSSLLLPYACRHTDDGRVPELVVVIARKTEPLDLISLADGFVLDLDSMDGQSGRGKISWISSTVYHSGEVTAEIQLARTEEYTGSSFH